MIAMLATAALAWYLVSPTAAMWVAGAAAVAGATALQDSPFDRVSAVLTVAVGSGLAVLVGALTGGHPAWFVAAVAVWCFAAGMCWAVDGDAGLTAAAVALLVVVAPPVGPALSEAAAAAVLAIVAGGVPAARPGIRPPRPWRGRAGGAPAVAGTAGGHRRGTGLAGRRRAAAGEWLGRPR